MWMVLAPHEIFEHSHSEESVTVLLDGELELLLDNGTRTPLVAGIPMTIAADTAHRLVNLAGSVAMVKCICQPAKDDPSH
jgi:quercetin dioxygenase-like cupin family protein